MNTNDIRSEVRSWVATAVLAESDPQPMTVEDAVYNIACYDENNEEYPEGMTAEMLAEAWNEEISPKTKAERIAVYLRDNEAVATNDAYIVASYHLGIKAKNPDYVPMDFLDDPDMCWLDDNNNHLSPLEIMYLYDRSCSTFRLTDAWFYYDSENKLLYSSNHPYHEGKIDAMEIAQFCLEHDEDLCDDEIRNILNEED